MYYVCHYDPFRVIAGPFERNPPASELLMRLDKRSEHGVWSRYMLAKEKRFPRTKLGDIMLEAAPLIGKEICAEYARILARDSFAWGYERTNRVEAFHFLQMQGFGHLFFTGKGDTYPHEEQLPSYQEGDPVPAQPGDAKPFRGPVTDEQLDEWFGDTPYDHHPY